MVIDGSYLHTRPEKRPRWMTCWRILFKNFNHFRFITIYRKAVMNQNGSSNGGSETGLSEDQKDGLINPVQRRESSASRFLKHFTRLDRSNPAYHSEGKGLRKRRNWNSERQLAQQQQQQPGDVSTAPDGGGLKEQPQQRNNNQPQRSHSFSEKPADHYQTTPLPSSTKVTFQCPAKNKNKKYLAAAGSWWWRNSGIRDEYINRNSDECCRE